MGRPSPWLFECGRPSCPSPPRLLSGRALGGKAPPLFGRLNGRGVPVAALLATGLISATAFFTSLVGDQKIYQIFYNASGLSGFIIWLGIAICHLRFRRAWVAQGRSLHDLKFRAKFYPYGPWLAVILFTIVLFGANIGVFQAPVFSWFDFISGYLMIATFIVL